MIRDPIVEQVRQQRHATEKSCGHDWKRLMEHYCRVQKRVPRLTRRAPKQWSPSGEK
ncbi:MAG: hypothetical protein WC058_02625 [Phycisphaeraceae bacterium]